MEEKEKIPPDNGKSEDTKVKKASESKELESSESDKLSIGKNEKSNLIEEDGEKLATLISSLSLNSTQKKEVKELFATELESAISSIKEEIKKESQDTKKDFLTFFGLFASFVTFLSIEVQLFKNNSNTYELIGVSSISLAFVMFFALILNDISKGVREFSDLKKPAYIINTLFLFAGVACLFMGSSHEKNISTEMQKNIKYDSLQIITIKGEQLNSDNKVKSLDSSLKQTNIRLDSLKINFPKMESNEPTKK